MKTKEEFYDFLKDITPENIAKVRANFEFDFLKYQTFYIVDTYDIIEYCFPFIFSTGFNFRSKLHVTNFLSYEFFFYDTDRKPIIMDEYRIEIFNFWFRLKRKIKEYSNYENLKDDMVKKYLDLQSEEEKIEFVQNNVGLLLSLAFGTINKEPIDRFNTLMRSALQDEMIKIANANDSNIIEDIFIDSKPNLAKVNLNFTKFCESAKYSLYGKNDDDTYRYLENSYRDTKVFDRIVTINNSIIRAREEGRLKNDYGFFYFSSASKKSKAIETTYQYDIVKRGSINNPSLIRSNIETYLYFLFAIGKIEDHKTQIITFLEKLETISRTYSDKAQQIDEFRKLFTSTEIGINQKLLEIYSQFDNLSIKYHAINRYQWRINEAIENFKKNKSDSDLFERFVDILNKTTQKKPTELLKELEDSIEAYTENLGFEAEIVEDIIFLKDPNRKYVIRKYPGTELIRNLPQSYPILLFHNKKNIKPIQELFLQMILDHANQTEVLGRALHPERLTPVGFSTPEKKLFFLFIRYLFDEKQTAESLIEEIDTLIVLNSKIRAKGEQMIDHFHVDLQPNYAFHVELVYLKAWILRKTNHNEDAISLLNKAIKDKNLPVDGRLIQSRGLCFKHQYYINVSSVDSDELKKYLKKALKDFVDCEKIFKEIQQKPNVSPLLSMTTVAISNSIADTFTKLYELDHKKHAKDIKKCRERIDNIKQAVKQLGVKYETFPVYSHTEMDVEACEAQIAFDGKNYGLADYKVNQARTRLNWIETNNMLLHYQPLNTTKRNLRKLSIAIYKATRGL